MGAQDDAFRAYVRQAAKGNGTADEPTKLADLRDRGAISEADFQRGKEKILSQATCPERIKRFTKRNCLRSNSRARSRR